MAQKNKEVKQKSPKPDPMDHSPAVAKILQDFGLAVYEARIDQEKSQLQVERESGVSAMTLNELEKGRSTNGIISKLYAVASAVGLELKIILTKS